MAKNLKLKPYSSQASNEAYNQLFCDDMEQFRLKADGPAPEKLQNLLKKDTSTDSLKELADDINLETQLRLLAFYELRRRGETISIKELLGVVVEVGEVDGLEVLAVYQDHSARYIDHNGKLSVWEAADPAIQNKIQNLLTLSRELVELIKPWEEGRLTPPIRGMVRLSFLVSDGLYFGQGPINHLQKDEMGGKIIRETQMIFAALMQKGNPKSTG